MTCLFFKNTKDLADGLGISVSTLQFLAYHRKVSKTTHYQRFLYAPKKQVASGSSLRRCLF